MSELNDNYCKFIDFFVVVVVCFFFMLIITSDIVMNFSFSEPINKFERKSQKKPFPASKGRPRIFIKYLCKIFMLHSCYAHTCKHTFIISMSVWDMYMCRCVRVCFYVMLNQKINMYLLGCDLYCRRWILYWTWMIHPDLWCWCQHLPKPCLQMLIFPQVCSSYGQQEFKVWSSTCYLPSLVSLLLQTILLY